MLCNKRLLFVVLMILSGSLSSMDVPPNALEGEGLRPSEALHLLESGERLSQSSSSSPSQQLFSPQNRCSSVPQINTLGWLMRRARRHRVLNSMVDGSTGRIQPLIYDEQEMTAPYVQKLVDFFPEELLDLADSIRDGQEKHANIITLVGPPGTGKSEGAKAFAIYCQMDYTFISGKDFGSEYQNSGCQNIIRLFEYARDRGSLVIIIDELQDLFKKTDRKDTSSFDSISNIDTHLEEVCRNPKIIVIFTANNLDDMPAAFRSRLNKGLKVHYSLPDAQKRCELFKFHFGSVQNNLSDADYQQLAKLSAGLSARDISGLPARSIGLARRQVRNRADRCNAIVTQAEVREEILKSIAEERKAFWTHVYDKIKWTGPYMFQLTTAGATVGASAAITAISLYINQKNVQESLNQTQRSLALTEASIEQARQLGENQLAVAKDGPGGWGVFKQILASVVSQLIVAKIIGNSPGDPNGGCIPGGTGK